MHTDPKKDLEGDIRNKLNSSRVVLEHILMEGKIPDRHLVEKAIASIDKIPPLVRNWFKKRDIAWPNFNKLNGLQSPRKGWLFIYKKKISVSSFAFFENVVYTIFACFYIVKSLKAGGRVYP